MAVHVFVRCESETIMYAIIKEKAYFQLFGACWHWQTLLSVFVCCHGINDHFYFLVLATRTTTTVLMTTMPTTTIGTQNVSRIPWGSVACTHNSNSSFAARQSCHLITIVTASYMCRILIANGILSKKSESLFFYVFFFMFVFFHISNLPLLLLLLLSLPFATVA